MRTALIQKDKIGFNFRFTDTNSAFRYLGNKDMTKDQMIQFFKNGEHLGESGRTGYDVPNIQFVNQKNEPCIYYKIKRGQNFAVCDFDPAKKVLFDFRADAVEHLKKYVSDEVLTDAEKIIEVDSKIEFLKRSASDETLKELETLLVQKKSDEGLTEVCRNHGKMFYNLPTIIEFQD